MEQSTNNTPSTTWYVTGPAEQELLAASRTGDVEGAKTAVKKGAKPQLARDVHGETPLHWAAAANKVELVRFLVDVCGCHVNARNWRGTEPLYYAASSKGDDTDVIELLLARNADPRAQSGFSGWTPSQAATEHGAPTRAALLKMHEERYNAARRGSAWAEYKMTSSAWWRSEALRLGAPRLVADVDSREGVAQLLEDDGVPGLLARCRDADDEAMRAVHAWHTTATGAAERNCLGCDRADSPRRCGRCKRAWFCNEDCQRRAWVIHRTFCRSP